MDEESLAKKPNPKGSNAISTKLWSQVSDLDGFQGRIRFIIRRQPLYRVLWDSTKVIGENLPSTSGCMYMILSEFTRVYFRVEVKEITGPG